MSNCEYSHKNKFGRLVCSLKEQQDTGESVSPLCPYQKYCGLSCEWQNNNNAGQCKIRREHGTRNSD